MRIALVGKYVQLHDAYLSVAEALKHAAIHHGVELEIDWVDAEAPDLGARSLARADGILVPGGFGGRGVEGKIAATRFARERERAVPRHLPRHADRGDRVRAPRLRRWTAPTPPSSTPRRRYPVIDLLPEQRAIEERGGTMRLGADPVHMVPGTRARAAYGDQDVIYERHRHRYEVNPAMRDETRARRPRGQRPLARRAPRRDRRAAASHPWFCASQFHPEFKSRPTRPQPLFREFVGAAAAHAGAREPAPARERAALGG